MLLICSVEKPESDMKMRSAVAAFRSVSLSDSLELYDYIIN